MATNNDIYYYIIRLNQIDDEPIKLEIINLPELDISLKSSNPILLNVNGTSIKSSEFVRVDYYQYTFKIEKITKTEIAFSITKNIAFPTYIKDIDFNLMLNFGDKKLQSACRSNKYLAEICNMNNFWPPL